MSKSEGISLRPIFQTVSFIIAVISFLGFIFSYGSMEALEMQLRDPVLQADAAAIAQDMLDVYIYGIASGAGISIAILLAYFKTRR